MASAILTSTIPTHEFTVLGPGGRREGSLALVISGADSSNTVTLERYLPAEEDANGSGMLDETWVPTGDEYSEDGEYPLRSSGSGRMRLSLTGDGPVRIRVWSA